VSPISEAPRGGDTGGASGVSVQAARLNVIRDSDDKRLPQLKCAYCGKSFPKTAKRPQRFCSNLCRKGMARQRTFGLPDGQSSTAGRYALKNCCGSTSCKATSRDLHPSRFHLPIDLLGRGHRRQGASKLDRKICEAILWREACAP